MELVLAPSYSAWEKSRLRDFYLNEVVNMDVSTVYLGEVICLKRDILSESDYKEIIAALKASGKTVYLSTLALITNNDELKKTLRHTRLFDGIEINSFGVLNLVTKDESLKGKDIVLGPFMNIYNTSAMNFMKKFNPKRLVTPYEVPYETIKEISKSTDVPLEICAWGHLSTALSWRCYTARMFDTTRDDCALKCYEYPDGVLLETMKKEDLYIANGIQVQSSKLHCLIEQIDMLKDIDMQCLRITPSYESTSDVVKIFNKVLSGDLDKKEAVKMLSVYSPHGLSNGWFLGRPGWEYVAA